MYYNYNPLEFAGGGLPSNSLYYNLQKAKPLSGFYTPKSLSNPLAKPEYISQGLADDFALNAESITPSVTEAVSSTVNNAAGSTATGMGAKLAGLKGKAGNLFGKLKGAAPKIAGGMVALQGLSNLSNAAEIADDMDDMRGSALLESASNPLLNQMMSASDMSAIRRLERGKRITDSSALDGVVKGALKGLPGALMTSLMAGGPMNPVGLALGLGSLASSGIEGYSARDQEETRAIEGLYNRLLDANQRYKASRPFNTMGIPMNANAGQYLY